MQNMYQTIFVFFVAFYFVYITLAIAAFWSSLKSTRKKSLKLRKLISVRELGQITVIPEVVLVCVTVLISAYAMGKWIFQQITQGCMTVAWWNPTCYDMYEFNTSWAAVFVIIAINAMMVTLIFDTKRQNKRLRR